MNIVLIAHDPKKKLMQNFCIAYRGILSRHDLYATETTGRLVEDATGLKVHKFLAGHLGGVQQIATQIESNRWIWLFSLGNLCQVSHIIMIFITLEHYVIFTTFQLRQILQLQSF